MDRNKQTSDREFPSDRRGINSYKMKQTERESGMVTAETALGALALGLIFTLMLSVIGAITLYLHAQDLSRSAARAVSIGHSIEKVQQSVVAEDSRATMQVEAEDDSIAVTVTLDPPAPIKALGFSISARTVAPLETGVVQ